MIVCSVIARSDEVTTRQSTSGLLRVLWSLAMTIVLVCAPLSAHAQDDAGTQAIRVLQDFYAQRNYRAIWTDGDHFTTRGRNLPDILQTATKHGLDPNVYGVARMRAVLSGDLPQSQAAWEQAEVFWTYGVWLYASDLLGQNADTQTLQSVLDGDVSDNLAALAPDGPLYKALQERLAQIDGVQPSEQPIRFNFGKTLKPGMRHALVPMLRGQMAAFGAYEVLPAENAADATLYDPNLAKAVARFQREYGLKSDGAIGADTLRILNRDEGEERVQIIANLQRLREPHRRLREDRRLEVSIARFWLTGFDDGHEVLGMPVVVGKPRRQTISFRTEVTGVRLNPDWNVPSTIKKEDFIPMLVQDPARLVRMHGVKIALGRQTLDPIATDWSQLSPQELAQIRFWRPAGEGNPLGRYRIIMENPYDIYLHDTNHPELFEASMRAQSSGCVRVAQPEQLAEFVLQGKHGWNPQKIKEAVRTGRTMDVVIENKLPIYLDYMTGWFNDRAQLVLGVDIYGLDKPRYDALVQKGLTTQRNAQKILNRATDILLPELKEAQHRDPVLTQSTN